MRKLLRGLIAAAMVCLMIPSAAFAETVSEGKADGMSEAEKEAYIAEMLETALEAYAEDPREIQMVPVGNGTEYSRQVYPLEDGCQLIMEFEDGAEGAESFMESGRTPGIMPMANNGETMWKDYGDRYFTAKATVIVGAGTASLILENHYTLSENGIDARYGVTDCNLSIGSMSKGKIEAIRVSVTDGSARTVGASDINIEAAYKAEYISANGLANSKVFNLETAVGYVDHNYSTRQIKVKHSWAMK